MGMNTSTVCAAPFTRIFSVSHAPRLCGPVHSVMIMWHGTVVRPWRVSCLTFEWDNRTCQCSESRILKSFPEDFCTFTEMLDNFLKQSKFKIHHMYIENMLSAKCSKIMSRWQNINKAAPGGVVPRGSWIFALYTLQCKFLSEDSVDGWSCICCGEEMLTS